MKKNKMMRTASGLLVATLLTTSVISGTFAKYTTEDEGSDTARVAKWGVTVSTSGNLFETSYSQNNADVNDDSIVAATDQKQTVNGSADVVAPGTKNDKGFTVAIAGTPEVAYDVAAEIPTDKPVKDIFLGAGDWGVMVEAKGLNAASDVTGYYIKTQNEDKDTYTQVGASGNWQEGETYYELMNHVEVADKYYPITWNVTHDGKATEVSVTENLETIATNMIGGLSKQNQAPGTAANASYTLTWEWPYESNNDEADTILGNLHAADASGVAVVYSQNTANSNVAEESYSTPTAETNYNLDINFNLKVTVTQVD